MTVHLELNVVNLYDYYLLEILMVLSLHKQRNKNVKIGMSLLFHKIYHIYKIHDINSQMLHEQTKLEIAKFVVE